MPEPQASASLKLFCSYAHEDEELRDELATHLSPLVHAGVVSVWYDGDIVPGQEWDEKIKEQLDSADIILLLVSPDFLASEYCRGVEIERAMRRHESDEARVIPVILRDCQWTHAPFAKLQGLPKRGRPIKPRRNRDAAFNEVAEGIRRAADELREKRKTETPETTPAAKPGPSSASTPKPSAAVIPRPPAVGFVARRDEQGRDIVGRLRTELAPGSGRLVALWGPGGSGKTTLAAEVARALRPAFDGRLAWVSAHGRSDFSLQTLLDDIATQLGRPDLRTLAPAAKEEQTRALLSSAPALVILDNFETIQPPDEQTRCATFLAACDTCPALITTRYIVQRHDITNARLAAMEGDEAQEFLRRLIEQSAKPAAFSKLDRDELIRECEATPLVMQWVVSQITLARRWQDVLDEIRRGSGDAATKVFDRSFDLPQLGDDGRDALLALCLFAPDASRELLARVAGFDEDSDRLDRAVVQLSALWLIEATPDNERLYLRGLTRTLAAARLARDPRAPEFRKRFVVTLYRYASAHERKTAEDFNALEPEKDNLLGAVDIASEQQLWQLVVLLSASLNEFLFIRGYWSEAVGTGEQALHAARALSYDSTVAALSHNLAVFYENRGEVVNAQRLYGESLEISERLGNDCGVADTLHQLGKLALREGNLAEAGRLYGESLEIARRLGNQLGISHTLGELGRLAWRENKLEEAQRFLNESLEMSRGLGNEGDMAIALYNLAELARAARTFGEARQLYTESLDITKRLGNQFGIASALNGLGRIAEEEGDKSEAARLFGRSLSILQRLGSPEAEMARENLARVAGGGD